MDRPDIWIERFRRRAHWGAFLALSARWLAVALLVWGGLVLFVKLAWPSLWPHAGWLAVAFAPLLGIAWWHSGRETPGRLETVALLDRQLQAGGLLMTLTERPDGSWSARLPANDDSWRMSLPRIRLHRSVRFLALPVLFAVTTVFVPAREARTTPSLVGVSRHATGELEELLETLEETGLLDEAEQQRLREEVERLVEETREAPLTHEKWEAIDALRERMRQKLDSAALEMARSRNAAALLAEAAAADGPQLTAERELTLQQDVLKALRQLASEPRLAGLSPELRDVLERSLKQGRLQLPADAELRQKMLNELESFLNDELDRLCRECEKRGGCDQPGGT